MYFLFLVLNHGVIIYIDFSYRSLRYSNWWSQIKSHIEYLIQTYNVLVLILYSKLMKNLASLAVFSTI